MSECDRTLEYLAIARVSAIPGMPDGWWEDHSVLDGVVVVDRDRFERLQQAARDWQWEWQSLQHDREADNVFLPRRFRKPNGLQPGDLDPLPVQGGGEG